MAGGNPASVDLEVWFNSLIVSGDGGKMERSAVAIAGWKDLPMELLLRVLSLLDDSTVFVASSVCKGWRIALCLGLTSFSLSWY
ncbi:hypothetical protein BHM03_00012996 [Ensete ventricosum]|nr:hypothetical protein BHM03_00012996 [Ensete ventricosum]